MTIEFSCFSCNETYLFSVLNTKIQGPIITTTCPKCNICVSKNWSSFLMGQQEFKKSKNLEKAVVSIAEAKVVWGIIEAEYYGKKDKKDKKS